MKSPLPNNPVPDFAIAQNDRTFESAVWVKESGEWVSFPSQDFDKLKMTVEIIRQYDSVEGMENTLKDIIKNRKENF